MDSMQQLLDKIATLEVEKAAALKREEAARHQAAVAAEREEAALKQAAASAEREEAAHKATFVAKLEGMSASASESHAGGGGSDVARRGAPAPVETEVDDVLSDFAQASRTAPTTLWTKARSAFSELKPLLSVSDGEVAGVHPAVEVILEAALAPDSGLRLWHEVIAADSNPVQEMKPDFVVTSARDAQPSAMGAALLVEVKLPGNLDGAVVQAANFGRRRMLRLFNEADYRGEPLHSLWVIVAATDGISIRFLHIRSGAPPPGETYKGAVPCPTTMTPALPLLLLANDTEEASHDPPLGFIQLTRVLSSSAAKLLCGSSQLFSSVRVSLRFASRTTSEDSPPFTLDFQLGFRLGSGGFSDAYSILPNSEGIPSGAVLKLARWTSAEQIKQFKREADTLRQLASASYVPQLLFTGDRDAIGNGRAPWPLHVLTPEGRPLHVALSEFAKSLGQSANKVCRHAFANVVLEQVHKALQAAHAAGIIHCDVRSQNCVIGPDKRACLLDWGLSRNRGDDATRVGVPAFTSQAVFSTSCKAFERLDLVAAALLWVCLAYGPECNAPWPVHCAPELAAERRREWFEYKGLRDGCLRSVFARISDLETPRRKMEAGDYQWKPLAEKASRRGK